MKNKPQRFPLVPRPGTLGLFVILIIALAFTAGQIRNELGLKLLAVVFTCILLWCFLAVFITGLANRKKAISLSPYITPGLVNIGGMVEIRLAEKIQTLKFFALPGALVRCEIKLETRDGRKINRVFNPSFRQGSFTAEKRGAYYNMGDEFFVSDAPGFFRLSFPLTKESGPRLLVLPSPAEENITLPVHSGGIEHRAETHYRRTDELSDHRPYVPGDDPRRINWKLYGHGTTGELFVREGEFEPPPHGRLLILIDTQTDAELFTVEEGRRALDLLCGIALEAALDFSSRGVEVSTAYTGGKISGAGCNEGDSFVEEDPEGKEQSRPGNTETALAAALAYPACLPFSSADDLPRTAGASFERKAEKMGILVFALPRISSLSSSLDRFLRKREAGKKTDILFVYETGNAASAERQKAAELCVRLYGKKPGLTVRGLTVNSLSV